MSNSQNQNSNICSENRRKVTIRLYRDYDIDLIYIFEVLYNSLGDARRRASVSSGDEPLMQKYMKTALRSYVNGIPKTETAKSAIDALCNPSSNRVLFKLRHIIQYHINLYAGEDDDLIEWIDGIRRGYRNAAVKNVIRWYIGRPCLFPSLTTTNVKISRKTLDFFDTTPKEDHT